MRKIIGFIIAIVFIQIVSLEEVRAEETKESIKILFTHDLHDRLENYDRMENGELKNVGGYARISTIIKNEKKDRENSTLVLDGGDFSMGTLYQTIFEEESPSLRILGKIGYDIGTIGNHEFDFRTEGLANSLMAAKNSGDKLPELVFSNANFSKDIDGDNIENIINLQNSFHNYGVKDYTVVERGGKKIGVFGVIGYEAISNAPMAGIKFDDYIDRSKEMVEVLKNKENVDMVVAISHSGTWKDKKKSEDEILAKKVPEIDVIVSGHTHTTLEEPIHIGNTLIVSSGSYGRNIGKLEIFENDKGKWELLNYELLPIDESVKEDEEIKKYIKTFENKVQENYLDRFNLLYDQVIGRTKFDFISHKEIEKNHKELGLTNLISDSYIEVIKEIEGEDYEHISASIIPAGTIRDSFFKGDITVSDVFNVSSLGIGPDKVSGYPILDVYLTGRDLKNAAEVDASITPIMSVAQLFISGVEYKFNPNRIIFNKVIDIKVKDESGNYVEIEDDKLYRVVAGLYTGQMLSVVKDQSYGILEIVPRDREGNEIVNLEDHIVYDNEGRELKEWYALASYIQSFEKDEDGISLIPEYYNESHGRKIADDSKNIIDVLEKPNKVGKAIMGLGAIFVLGIGIGVGKVIKNKRKKKQ